MNLREEFNARVRMNQEVRNGMPATANYVGSSWTPEKSVLQNLVLGELVDDKIMQAFSQLIFEKLNGVDQQAHTIQYLTQENERFKLELAVLKDLIFDYVQPVISERRAAKVFMEPRGKSPLDDAIPMNTGDAQSNG